MWIHSLNAAHVHTFQYGGPVLAHLIVFSGALDPLEINWKLWKYDLVLRRDEKEKSSRGCGTNIRQFSAQLLYLLLRRDNGAFQLGCRGTHVGSSTYVDDININDVNKIHDEFDRCIRL